MGITQKYSAVLTHADKEVSPIIYFSAGNLQAAKSKATRELVADDGTWQTWIEENQWKKVVILPELTDTGKRTKSGKRIMAQQEGASILLTRLN